MQLLRLTLLLSLLVPIVAFAKDNARITIQVIDAETKLGHYNYTTPGRDGTAKTNCTTNGTTNGTINNYGSGPILTHSTSSGNTDCTTTTTPARPPQTHIVNTVQQLVYALLPDGRQMTLSCQKDEMGGFATGLMVGYGGVPKSGTPRCSNLQPGNYEAEIHGNSLTIFIHELSGKEHKIKYRAVSVSEMQTTPPSAPQQVPANSESMSTRQSARPLREQSSTGDAEAQFHNGTLYETGKGVPQDYTQAVYWYRKAAGQNLAIAQYRLGVLYANGVGVPLDKVQAAAWFQMAAAQGYVYAQEMLGSDYLTGDGVQRDYAEAYFWYAITCASNAPERVTGMRVTMRDTAARYLSPAELAQVQEQVRQWLENHPANPQ